MEKSQFIAIINNLIIILVLMEIVLALVAYSFNPVSQQSLFAIDIGLIIIIFSEILFVYVHFFSREANEAVKY